jgi:hypothetical protein
MLKKWTLRKLSIRAVGLFVVLPTMLMTLFWGLIAAAKLYSFLFQEGAADRYKTMAHLTMGICLVLGIAGVVTAVKLHDHFLRSDAAPAWAGFAWVGLLCGTAVNISLMVWVGGSLAFRVFFLGWPLIGAMTFGWLLWSSQKVVPVK